MNIKKMVATGILGATAMLTGCDSYKNTQRVLARDLGITSQPSAEQQETARQLDEQRKALEHKKLYSTLDTVVGETHETDARLENLDRVTNAYNDFIAQHPESAPLAVFKGFEKPIYTKHDLLVRKAVSKWNAQFASVKGYVPLEPDFVKAIMLVESGSPADADSWSNDPMSLAHAGDVGFEDLVKKDAAHFVPGNAYLRTLERTPRKDGTWDYSFTPAPGKHKITAEESITEGIHLLCKKSLKFEMKDGKLEASFTGWLNASERYNGGKDKKEYVKKVEDAMKSICHTASDE